MGFVRQYNYNPLNVLEFKGKPRWGVFFGVELELEIGYVKDIYSTNYIYDGDHCTKTQQQTAKNIIELLGEDFVICKRDGSLDHGIEVVSAPASMVVHKARWPKLFGRMEELKLTAEKSCGMHVHMSRKVFTNEQIVAMQEFICGAKSKAFVTKIAGRTSPDYAAMQKKAKDFLQHVKCADWSKRCEDCRTNGLPNDKYSSHHDALDVTHENTLELRIFASTTDETRFFVNLEFTQALCGWVLQKEAPALTVAEFRKYVEVNHKLFPSLVEFITSKVASASSGQ